MKTFSFKGLSLTIIFSIFMVIGCDIVNPIEGVRAILNTKERTTTVTLIFTDVESAQPIGAAGMGEVDVTISGKDSAIIIDMLNRPKTSFKSSNGFVSFAVKDEVLPDKENPVEITITAVSDNYQSVTRRIKVSNTRGNPFEITMIQEGIYPTGAVGDVVSAGNVIDGATDREYIFETPPELITGTKTSVTIREGSIIRDASGVLLQGELSASLVHYTNVTNQSIASFPGGLSSLYIDEENDVRTGFFTPAGFLRLQIRDDSGRLASNFSEPLEIRLETNRTANAAQLDVWSLSSTGNTDGVWKYENATETITLGNGKQGVEIATNHLSWYAAGTVSEVCQQETRIHFLNNDLRLNGELYRADNDVLMGTSYSRTSTEEGYSSYMEFDEMPVGVPAYLELYNIYNDLVLTVNIDNLCGTTTNVDLSFLDTITVVFKGVGICESLDNKEVRPSFPALYRPDNEDGIWLPAGEVVNGELEITLPEPDQFLFGSYYEDDFTTHMLDLQNATDGVVYERTIIVPEEYCEGL